MKSEGNWAQKNRVIGKAKPCRGLTRMRADQEEIPKIAEIERQNLTTEARRRGEDRGSENLPLMNADQKRSPASP